MIQQDTLLRVFQSRGSLRIPNAVPNSKLTWVEFYPHIKKPRMPLQETQHSHHKYLAFGIYRQRTSTRSKTVLPISKVIKATAMAKRTLMHCRLGQAALCNQHDNVPFDSASSATVEGGD